MLSNTALEGDSAMNIIESLKVAVNSILSNRMRSFLTMLGIIIGIASVIAIAAIGEGGKKYISRQFEKIGSNVVEVSVGDKNVALNDYFTLNDIASIKQKVPSVKAATPMVTKVGVIKGGKVTKDALTIGTTEDYSMVFNIEMVYGRFINDRDVLAGKNIVIIDESAARKLFGYGDCVGQTVKVGGRLTQATAIVVGVIKSGDELIASVAGDNMPTFVYLPVTFLKKIFPEDFTINQLEISLYDYSSADSAVKDMLRLMERAHSNKEKYKAQNLLKQLDSVNDILNKFTLIISAIAAISLIVGGIGVMNIMLVSVTERTREIGIRKALGATKGNILTQFLTEAVIISLIGGLLGLLIGLFAGVVIGSILGLNSFIRLWVILLVMGLTFLIGVFFGIYPAKKAAKLDPIEALRYE